MLSFLCDLLEFLNFHKALTKWSNTIFDRLKKAQFLVANLSFYVLSVRFTHEKLCVLIVWVSFEVSYMGFLCYIMGS